MNSVIQTGNAPAAVGPYSQGIKAGNTIYVSGQLAFDPATGELYKGGDIQEETKICLMNLKAILEAGGASLKDVVKCTVYIKDMNQFGYLLEHGRANFEENGTFDDNIIIPPVFIHPDARVNTSILGPFVSIGAGSIIHNSTIKDSILSQGAHITNATLEGSLLGYDVVINGMKGKFNLGDNSWANW